MQIVKGYQLRAAAGGYFLLNMEQKGVPYQSPVPINSVGAEIWSRLNAGESVASIIEHLGTHCGASKEEIQKDVLAFLNQLEAMGILAEK